MHEVLKVISIIKINFWPLYIFYTVFNCKGWNLKWSCRIYVYSSFVGLYKSSQYHIIWSFSLFLLEKHHIILHLFCYCTNSNHNFTHYYYKQNSKKPRRNLLSFFITSLRYRVLKLVHLRVL